MKKENTVNDFIGIFHNAASKEYCEKVIKLFEFHKECDFEGQRKTRTRQEIEQGTPRINKDSEQYFFQTEDVFLDRNALILKEFVQIIWASYSKFRITYGTALEQLKKYQVSPSIKIQKYEPTQGYHVWHCDTDSVVNSGRMLVCMLYLNTVKKGGETEFLYQRRRISAVQGTLVFFPTVWTHLHRGNPPLEGNKYILNTWLEFCG